MTWRGPEITLYPRKTRKRLKLSPFTAPNNLSPFTGFILFTGSETAVPADDKRLDVLRLFVGIEHNDDVLIQTSTAIGMIGTDT